MLFVLNLSNCLNSTESTVPPYGVEKRRIIMRLVGIIFVAAVIGSIDCTCQKIGSFAGVGYSKEFYYESNKEVLFLYNLIVDFKR